MSTKIGPKTSPSALLPANDTAPRARKPRAPKAAPIVDPKAPPAVIPSRKVTSAAHPHVTRPGLAPAPAWLDGFVASYFAGREAESEAKAEKERAGDAIALAIGSGEGVQGPGYVATWRETEGGIDWTALARDLDLDAETIERYRRPGHRTLKVDGAPTMTAGEALAMAKGGA